MNANYSMGVSIIILLSCSTAIYGMLDTNDSDCCIKKSASHDHVARMLHTYKMHTRSHLKSRRSYGKQEVYHSDVRRLHADSYELPTLDFNSDDESGRRDLVSHPYWNTCDRTQVAEKNEWHQQPQPAIEVSLGNEFLYDEFDADEGLGEVGPRQHVRTKGGRRGSHPNDNARSIRDQQRVRGRCKSFAEGDAFGRVIAHHSQERNMSAHPVVQAHSLGATSMHSAAASAREKHGHTHGISRQSSVASMRSAAASARAKHGRIHGHIRRDSMTSMHSFATSARQKHERERRKSSLSGDILNDDIPAGSGDMLRDDLSEMAYSVSGYSDSGYEDEMSYQEDFSDAYSAHEHSQSQTHTHPNGQTVQEDMSFAQFYEDFREDFHGTPYFLPMIALFFAYNQYPKLTVASVVCAGAVAIWKHDVLLRWWRDAKEKTNDTIDFTRKIIYRKMVAFKASFHKK